MLLFELEYLLLLWFLYNCTCLLTCPWSRLRQKSKTKFILKIIYNNIAF